MNLKQTPEKKAVILFSNHPANEAVKKKLGSCPKQSERILQLFHQQISLTLQELRNQESFQLFIATDRLHAEDPYTLSYYQAVKPCYFQQIGRSFGERLEHTISTVFQRGYSKVVVIGNDCIEISPKAIQNAFKLLDNHNIAVGPAKDGGIYLIGLNQNDSRLFKNIPWCSSHVYTQLLNNAKSLKEKIGLLETLTDIDSGNELRQWCSLNRESKHFLFKLIQNILDNQSITVPNKNPFILKNLHEKEIWQKPPPVQISIAT